MCLSLFQSKLSNSNDDSDQEQFKGRRRKRVNKADRKKEQWELDLEKKKLDPKKVKEHLR